LPKKGILINIHGIQKGDSISGIAEIPVSTENMSFKGIIKGNELSGVLLMGKEPAEVKGFKTNETKIDYKFLYPKMMEVTENNIFSKDVLQTKEWKKFQTDFEKLCNNAVDDLELYIGFSVLSPKLPFSHYYFIMKNDEETEEEIAKDPDVIFEEKTPETAYMKIKNLSTSEKEILEVFPKIIAKNYKNLIVDLRGNGGGGLEAAFAFGKYVMKETTDVGYFVTNKFQFSSFDKNLFDTLPITNAKITEDFIEELKNGKGERLVVQKLENSIFSGKIYILTDKHTGSTCEPLVYVMKNKGWATIVGENTAGAMLSGTIFDISGKYKLFLPIADFYTYDGVRLEKLGVAPNIATKPEDALTKTLELIGK
jgi:hypothetical protein